MHINYVTAFPEFFTSPFNTSMLKKAREKKIFLSEIYDLRDYTLSKHKQVDDEPYGGKAGMLLKAEPFFRAMQHITQIYPKHRVIYCGPEGEKLNQTLARELSKESHLTFLCGHFKGIDNRVLETFVTDRISIGDYIVTGGELAALTVTDALVRLIPGVLQDLSSANTDSFEDDLLDADYYTRPAQYLGLNVPDVLLSGNHELIEQWTIKKKLEKTKKFRPDLLASKTISKG
jgi:tRNA (guanine37-N1)-methyltransferase